MDCVTPEKEKSSFFAKATSEKCLSYVRNIPHAILLRENGFSRYQNQLASEFQIAAEEQLTRKEYEETKCQLPDVTRSTYLVVFSPDGKKMASSHGNHNVYVTDVKTGKNLNTLSGHPRTPWCIAFHPSSNQILASGCLGGQVRVWDLHGGSEIWTVEGQTSIASLAFHPTDRLLVVASYNEILFWDWSQPEPFAKCCTQNEKEKIRYVAFDFAGSKLITGIENPQPLQSQWDRVGPVRYVSLPGSPRGPRPLGPRPGFGSVFSHTNSSTGPGSSPASGTSSHPLNSSTLHGNPSYNSLPRPTPQLRQDERRAIGRNLSRTSSGQISRSTRPSVADSLLLYQNERRMSRHFMAAPSSTVSSADGNFNSNRQAETSPENNADFGDSWMWRSQHSLRDSSPSVTTNRSRFSPILGRRNTEYGRLHAASRNHRRHLQVLLDQCRRYREQNSLQRLQVSPFSTNYSVAAHNSKRPCSHSNVLEDGPQTRTTTPNTESSSPPEAVIDGLPRLEASPSSHRSHAADRISTLTENVQHVLQVLSEHINSMHHCSHCLLRIDSFRLNHIRQLWAEMQRQIRSLQVTVWENAGLASNAWHRFSFEAITEMLSHMSHQDRREESLNSSSGPVNVVPEHVSSSAMTGAQIPSSSSIDSSCSVQSGSESNATTVQDDTSSLPQTSGESVHQSSSVAPVLLGDPLPSTQSSCPSVISTVDPPVISSFSSESVPLSLSPVESSPSSSRTEHGARERESLHITWVDQSARGRTAVGVVSRRDDSTSVETASANSASSESQSTQGSPLHGRLFRIRRQNMLASTSQETSDVSRVHPSVPIRSSSLSSEGFPATNEPRAPLPVVRRFSPPENFNGQLLSSQRLPSDILASTLFQENGFSPSSIDASLNPQGTPQQRTETEGSDASPRAFPLTRVGTRRINDDVSLLRYRLFLKKSRLSAWRIPRFKSTNSSNHNSSRSFGSRRAVLALAVNPQQEPISSNTRTEGVERTPDNMLMRIFRSLRRSSPHLNSAADSSRFTGAPFGDSRNVPILVGESPASGPSDITTPISFREPQVLSSGSSPTSTRFNISNPDPGRQRWTPYGGPNDDLSFLQRPQLENPNISVRSSVARARLSNGSPNLVETSGTGTECWANRLLRLHLHQQLRQQELWQHQARLHSRYSSHLPRSCLYSHRHHRFGPCGCGGCIYMGSNISQARERLHSREVLSRAPSYPGHRTSQYTTSMERNNMEAQSSQSSRNYVSPSVSSASIQLPPASTPSQIHSLDETSLFEEETRNTSQSGQVLEDTPLSPDSETHASSVSPSLASVSLNETVNCSDRDQFHSQNTSRKVKLESKTAVKPGSSRLTVGMPLSNKLKKTSKCKEFRSSTNSKRRSFHQTNFKKKASSLKTHLRRNSEGSQPNQDQHQIEPERIPSSSAHGHINYSSNFSPPSSSPSPSQLPEPTFSRQLENLLNRFDHLIFLQRNALNPPSGEQNQRSSESHPLRTAGDGVRENYGPSDAVSITSNLLTRLTESLVRQLQIIQQARERRNNSYNDGFHNFSTQSSSNNSIPSAHRSPMMTETRQRAEELLNVMMDNLASFSRESSLGESFSDNSGLEHIQTMSASFWLLQGLYMSLHLALELADVLLNHIIASYETNDSHDEPRVSLSQPCVCPTSSLHSWMQVRSAFAQPHSWTQTASSSSPSSSNVLDGRASSSITTNPASTSSATIVNDIFSRIRRTDRVFPSSSHSASNNRDSALPNGALNSTSGTFISLNGSPPSHNDTSNESGSPDHGTGAVSPTPLQGNSHFRLSVPTVQVNDVPLSEINEWQPSSSTVPSSPEAHPNSREIHTSPAFNGRWTSPPGSSPVPSSTEGGRPGPFRVRPRLLHPHYSRYAQDPFLSNEGDFSAQSLLFHLDYTRSGGSFLREPFFSSEEHRIHRIQLWDFSKGLIPDISKADKNLVVAECKIHNDASVDVSAEGHLLVALLPLSRTVLHPHLAPSVGQSVGVYSLVWESLGQLLYTTSLDQAAVSVALSPTAAYLLVGLVSRRTVLMPNDHHAFAQIFRLEGARPGRPIGARGRLNLHRDIDLRRDHVASSLNCIRWAPIPGQGFVYGTNTGALVILR